MANGHKPRQNARRDMGAADPWMGRRHAAKSARRHEMALWQALYAECEEEARAALAGVPGAEEGDR